jgi:hypothetical protein
MNGHGQTDSLVVPTKSPNKAGRSGAEGMEGRGLAKGNSPRHNALRTQGRAGASNGLERVREVAARDKKVRFTALLHHIYDRERLKAAYYALKGDAAPGVDGETWRHYGEALEANLADLSDLTRLFIAPASRPCPAAPIYQCRQPEQTGVDDRGPGRGMTHRAFRPGPRGTRPNRPFRAIRTRLCFDITPIPESAPEHFPHQAGHHP